VSGAGTKGEVIVVSAALPVFPVPVYRPGWWDRSYVWMATYSKPEYALLDVWMSPSD
jgi:hypothetical protein